MYKRSFSIKRFPFLSLVYFSHYWIIDRKFTNFQLNLSTVYNINKIKPAWKLLETVLKCRIKSVKSLFFLPLLTLEFSVLFSGRGKLCYFSLIRGERGREICGKNSGLLLATSSSVSARYHRKLTWTILLSVNREFHLLRDKHHHHLIYKHLSQTLTRLRSGIIMLCVETF